MYQDRTEDNLYSFVRTAEDVPPEMMARFQDLMSQKLVSDDPIEIDEALHDTEVLLRWKPAANKQKSELASEFVANNLGRLTEIVHGNNPEQALQAATVMYRSWVSGKEAHTETAAVVKSLLPKIIADYPLDKNTDPQPLSPLAEEFINDFSYRPYLMNQGEDITRQRFDILVRGRVLEAFGCHYPTRIMRDSWCEGTKQSWRKSDMARAMQTMSAVESMQPGLVNELQRTNHIRNFQRYTPDMLYAMHRDQIEQPDKDYVLMIQSVADHNNAFKAPKMYEKMYNRLQHMGYGLRIYECMGLRELDGITQQVLHDYTTDGARVACEVIAGHGRSQSITMSNYDTPLNTNFLDKTHHAQIARAFTKDARVQLYSCATGQEIDGKPSIARELARSMGRTVLAPRAVAYSESEIRPIRKGDGVNLQLEYRRKKGTKQGKRHLVPSAPLYYKGATMEPHPVPAPASDSDTWSEWLDLSNEAPRNRPYIKLVPLEDF